MTQPVPQTRTVSRVLTFAKFAGALLGGLCALWSAGSVRGQINQFPSPASISTSSSFTPSSVFTPNAPTLNEPPLLTSYTTGTPSNVRWSSFDPYATPRPTQAPLLAQNPTYTPPPVYNPGSLGNVSGGAPPGYYGQTPANPFSPGGVPANQVPDYGFPGPGAPGASGLGWPEPVDFSEPFPNWFSPAPRGEHISFSYLLLVPEGTGFGWNAFDFNLTWQLPLFHTQPPLWITPGFTLSLVEGPTALDLPPQVYDIYLDLQWRPRITSALALDLSFRPTISTDFHQSSSDMFRFPARALALVTLSQQWTLVAGAIYYDRRTVNLLPALGLTWMPNEDTRFELVFPRPKLAQRLPQWGNTDLWWYVAGEIGGGQWAIERDASHVRDLFDYYDLRLVLGLDLQSYQGPRGYVEAGYVFNREIDLRTSGIFKPDDTLMIRTGLRY